MVLSSVDPNLPQSTPTTKDKKDFRTWTFPRTNSPPASSSQQIVSLDASASSPAPIRDHSSQSTGAGVHAHSSSISPNKARSTKRGSRDSKFTSKDFRHRTNASLVAQPVNVSVISGQSTVPVSHPSPSKNTSTTTSSRGPSVLQYATSSSASNPVARPLDLLKMVYSNIRRRSASDLLHTLIFGGCLVVFAMAITGHGDMSLSRQRGDNSRPGQRVVAHHIIQRRPRSPEVIDVKIPDAFMPVQQGSTGAGEPAALHQPGEARAHADKESIDVEEGQATGEAQVEVQNENPSPGRDSAEDGDFAMESQGNGEIDELVDAASASSEVSEDLANTRVDIPEGEGDPNLVAPDEDLVVDNQAVEGNGPVEEGASYEQEVAAARRRSLERRQRLRGDSGSEKVGADTTAAIADEQAGRGRMVKKARPFART